MKELILNSLTELNQHSAVFNEIHEGMLIYDQVDSFFLLELILDLEKKLKDRYGRYIQIADSDIMSEEKSPFLNINTLVSFLESKVKDA